LQQILTNRYAEKYRASGKRITGIGVNFNEQQRTIEDWQSDLI
jgi:hypothetical protein